MVIARCGFTCMGEKWGGKRGLFFVFKRMNFQTRKGKQWESEHGFFGGRLGKMKWAIKKFTIPESKGKIGHCRGRSNMKGGKIYNLED